MALRGLLAGPVSGGAPASGGNTPAPAPSSGGSTGLRGLLSTPVRSTSPAPTPAPAPAPVAPAPRERSAIGGFLSDTWNKVSYAIDDAISVDEEEAARIGQIKNPALRTLAFLPSETVRHLPLGIGQVITQIQDDPETAANITFGGTLKEVPGVAVDTAKAFVKMPIQAALDAAGAAAQPISGGRLSAEIKFDIPGLGEVSNAQFRVAERVRQGDDPVVATLEEGAGAIFETLFAVDLLARPFMARRSTTARFETEVLPGVRPDATALPGGPQIVSGMPKAPVDYGPKSFRLYQPPTMTKPLPPAAIEAMQAQGINLGPKFNPSLPTYFRVQMRGNNMVRGQVIQLKPSIFDSLLTRFKGGQAAGATSNANAATARAHIKTSQGMDIDDAIAKGDIPEASVYQDRAKGVLTQGYAEGRIQDVAAKLDQFKPGLGDTYRATVNPSNTTMGEIINKGLIALDGNVQFPPITGALEGGAIPGSVYAAIPKDAVEVIHERAVNLERAEEAVQNPTIVISENATDAQNIDEAARRLESGSSPTQVAYELSQYVDTTKAEELVQAAQQRIANPPEQPSIRGQEAPITVQETANADRPILPEVSYNTLAMSPAEIQKRFGDVDKAFMEETADLRGRVAELESKLAAAPAKSPQKKSLKQELAKAKTELRTFEEDHTGVSKENAEAFRDFLTTYLKDESASATAVEIEEVVEAVLDHIIDPDLIRANGTMSIAEIASGLLAERAAVRAGGKLEVGFKFKWDGKEVEITSIVGNHYELTPVSGKGTSTWTNKPGIRSALEANERGITTQQLMDLHNERVSKATGLEWKGRKSNAQKVKEAVEKKGEAGIKEIAEETKVLEPSVRRILGQGAKKGTFERVDKGVYKVKVGDKDVAVIFPGDALEVLPKLVKDGFEADMVFLDIPYDIRSVRGGNRGANNRYGLISVEEFGKVLDSVKQMLRTKDSALIHMFSQAESGKKDMAKYNDLLIEKGFKPVGRGAYTKLTNKGKVATFPTRNGSQPLAPEGILILNQSGKAPEKLAGLDFKLLRPKGYHTEKPRELLDSLIEMTTAPGDMVLDPFAGSGVAPERAVAKGRKAVAIEKAEGQAEKIAERVAAATGEKSTSLAEEAKKYPTAEEFVRAQTLVYHGSAEPLEAFNENGAFFTDDYMNADGYAGGENIYEGYLDLKNPLVIDAKGRKWDDLDSKYGKSTQAVAGSLDTKKYDGVIFENIKDSWIDDVDAQEPGTIYYAANANKAFLNEEQLIELYEKATGSTARSTPKSAEEAAATYWDRVIAPRVEKGEAVIIGADDLKDYFGNDYDVANHPIYSKAANDLFERAIKELPAKTVKFTAGGTGAGKSDFLVPGLAEEFQGVIYDSTAWNYDGLAKQIAFAKENGVQPEVYGILSDIPRAKAYTFMREARGEHPVSEGAFARTHAAIGDTLSKLIAAGEDVYVLDLRTVYSKEDLATVDYQHNPVDLLAEVRYTEDHVKELVKGITKENAEAITKKPGAVGQVPGEDGPASKEGESLVLEVQPKPDAKKEDIRGRTETEVRGERINRFTGEPAPRDTPRIIGAQKPRITKGDLKRMLSGNSEFSKNPVLKVENIAEYEGDPVKLALTFTGETSKFRIMPGALGLVAKNLKEGDTIRVDRKLLDGDGQEIRAKLEGSSTAYANIGNFADGTPVKAGGMQAINPIEMPELVSIAREILKNPPRIVKRIGRKDETRGRFTPGILGGGADIQLRADLFKDVEQAAKTLAHEIGHLVDFLPEGTMKRGNLIGRLLTLRSFMSSTFNKSDGAPLDLKELRTEALKETLEANDKTFGDYMSDKGLREKLKPQIDAAYNKKVDAGADLKNATIKNELVAVSDYWRPWDRASASPSYVKYRNRSEELYADAISMMFNSPGLLEEMAPTFYNEFLANLDRKPDARDAFFGVQSLLSGDRSVLVKSRREGVQQMFNEGDMKAGEVQRKHVAEQEERNSHLGSRIKFELLDKHAYVIERVKQLEKEGKPVNPDDNPLYYLEARNYLGGKIKNVVEDFNTLYQDLRNAGIAWDQMGEMLFYERIAAGDRSDLANPRGITPQAAQELLDDMRAELGPEKYELLADSAEQFRDRAKAVAEEAYREGLYSDELYQNMKDNPKYATFQVLDHMETTVSAKVFKSVGTFKDVANPADASILKAIATIRAIERNKVSRAVVDFLKKDFATDIKEADKRFNGKVQTFVESKNFNEELVMLYRKGKVEGYYVDKYISASIRNESVGQNLATLSAIRYMNRFVFRPLFITFSPGFQAFNFLRDFQRYWKNIPDMTMKRALQRYIQAVPMAKVRAFGIDLDKATPKELAAYFDLRGLEKDQVLGITFNDILIGGPEDERQIETILRNSGISSFDTPPTARRKALAPFIKVLDFIKNTGDLIETLPKAAGFYEFREKNNGGPLTKEQESYIRKYLGSPDFLAGGMLKPATNELFLFSNAIAQGIRSDYYVATNPTTRSGYWWKTAKVNVLPKILMYLATLGAFGAAVKEVMEGASEYDKTSYTIIPLGVDGKTGKPIYFRMPQDETGRLIGGLVWKFITAPTNTQPIGNDITDIISFTGGQIPTITPSITALTAAVQYASGRNPYDAFRGREVLSEDVYKAGGWPSLKAFIGWELNQLGAGIFFKFYHEPQSPQEKGPLETVVNLPIVSNVLGRFIRVSNYGKQEELNNVREASERSSAQQRLKDNDVINEYLDKALEDPARKNAYRKQLRLAIMDGSKLTPDTKRRVDRALDRYDLGIMRGSADPETTALLNASSNSQKADILKEIEEDMGDDFNGYLAELLKKGVISPDVVEKYKAL